jgi:hypothetical protein
VASAHTRLVGFPTSQENYQRLQRHQRKGKKTDVTAYALGGAAAVVLVAGAAVLFTFGDVVATAGNIAGFVGAGEWCPLPAACTHACCPVRWVLRAFMLAACTGVVCQPGEPQG